MNLKCHFIRGAAVALLVAPSAFGQVGPRGDISTPAVEYDTSAVTSFRTIAGPLGGADEAEAALRAGECQHYICLQDSWGDGWNGGYVDITVDGNPPVQVTQTSGQSNPVCYYFLAETGDSIDVTYHAGAYPEENFYIVYDTNFTELCAHWGYDASPNCSTVGNCEPCDVVCTGTPENEPQCGDDYDDVTNGGCNSTPEVFQTITDGETVCGESGTYTAGSLEYRDTDWFEITTASWSTLTWTIEAEFPVQALVIDGNSGCAGPGESFFFWGQAAGDPCQTTQITTPCLPPGVYWLWVGPQSGEQVACGTEYSATVTTTPCAPEYCAADVTYCDEFIGGVEIGSLVNTPTGCDGYADYTALPANVNAGQTHTLTVANGGTPYVADTVNAWVDWDNDFVFAMSERYQLASLDGGVTFKGDIDVPVSASGGYRMRVRMAYGQTVFPCGGADWGEVEDYTLTVAPVPPSLTLEPEQDCYAAGDQVCVDVFMNSISEDIVGAQFFLNYDTNVLTLNAGAAAVVPGDAPMSQQVYECSLSEQSGICTPAAGAIGYGVGTPTPAPQSVTGRWKLATICFTTSQDICDFSGLLTWEDPHLPPTRLTTDAGGYVLPQLLAINTADTESPVITAFPANGSYACPGEVPPADTNLVGAVDNCDTAVTVTHEGDVTLGGSGCPANPLTIARTYRATDFCGNAIEAVQYFEIADNVPPIITGFPANGTYSCQGDIPLPNTALVSTTDNCGGGVTVSWVGDAPNGGAGCLADPLVIMRTYRATDACGNFVEQDQTFYVIDQTQPVIDTFPANAEYDCLADVPAPDTGLVGATDNCGGTVTITHEGDVNNGGAGCPSNSLIINRTYRATDACGNYSEQNQTITVIDDVDPSVDGFPADAEYDCIADVPGPDIGLVTGSDNCSSVTVSWQGDSTTGGAGCLGDPAYVTRTYRVTDACGNFVEQDQVFTIIDDTPPTVDSYPSDISVNADAGGCTAEVSWTAAVASDNCAGAVTVTYWDGGTEITSPHTFTSGVTTVTVQAEDACGNITNTDTFDVEVMAFNTFNVNVEVEGSIVSSGFIRCITFEFFGDCPSAPLVFQKDVTFDSTGLGSAVFTDLPCGDYTCVTAQDELHTLVRQVSLAVNGSFEYEADFTGTNLLLQGDYYDDVADFGVDFIDIVDFGVWIADFSETYLNGDTLCGAPFTSHADAYGGGAVSDTSNYTFVTNNFGTIGDGPCCPIVLQAQPATSISTNELREIGLGRVVPYDLDDNGVFDMTDVRAFMNGERPTPNVKAKEPRLQGNQLDATAPIRNGGPVELRR